MTTNNEIYAIVDDGDILLPSRDNYITIETHQDSDDGTFPKVNDYIKFYNKVRNNGIEHWLNYYDYDKDNNHIKFDGFVFTPKHEKSEFGVLKFDKPIKVCFGKIGDKLVIDEVSEIRGHFDFECWFVKNGLQNKLPNVIRLLFQIEEYIT